jgi:hypothetical protein
VARVAVVAGTATAVSNRVSRRQANRWAGEEQQQQQQYAEAPAPEAPAAEAPDMMEQLKQLGELHTSGVLTDAEFEAQKAKLLAGG